MKSLVLAHDSRLQQQAQRSASPGCAAGSITRCLNWPPTRGLAPCRDVLLAGLAGLMVASCGPGEERISVPRSTEFAGRHPGFGSPARLDGTLVPVRMGNTFYRIPANYFDAPLQSKGKDGEFRIISSMLLLGAAPNFEGRSEANRRKFKGRGHEPVIYVLASDAPVGSAIALRRLLARALKDGKILQEQMEGDVRHLVVERSGEIPTLPGKINDVYLYSSGEYAACGRIAHEYSQSCQYYYDDGDNLYKIRIGSGWIESKDELFAAARSTIDSWKVEREVIGGGSYTVRQ